MVSSLNFIRVIAAICHIEGDVPVDKYMDAYKPEKVRQHILNKRNWYFKPHSVFCKRYQPVNVIDNSTGAKGLLLLKLLGHQLKLEFVRL